MRPNDLDRKNVISKEGRQLGSVIDIEIDASTWKVTHLRLGLVDKMLQPFGLTIEKKPGEKCLNFTHEEQVLLSRMGIEMNQNLKSPANY